MNAKDLRDSVENAIEKTYLFSGDFEEAADAAIAIVVEAAFDLLTDRAQAISDRINHPGLPQREVTSGLSQIAAFMDARHGVRLLRIRGENE